MEPKQLDRVTLILCDTVNYGQAILSMTKTLTQILPVRSIFFTDIDLPVFDDRVEVIKIPSIKSKEEYSNFIVKELYKYIETDFVLITQWDATVLNGQSWKDEYYDYDMIGAPWLYQDGRNVGNGGGSLRSKRLMTILGTDPFIEISHPEDEILGRLYRGYLEKTYGIKFPSEELADSFSYELRAPTQETFMHHSFFHKPFKGVVVVRRTGAMGDVIMVEPVLEHFHKQGFRVVLETMPQFYNLFANHYFKIHHPEELDTRVLKTAKAINLDMGYEITPKQLHLKSYYEICGIKNGEIRNPKLRLPFNHKDPSAKLFKKYVVLHLDVRPQLSRNSYEIEWGDVVWELQNRGYTVVQIGQGERQVVEEAVQMHNLGEMLLMRVIGGADIFIGHDSGPANIAIAMDTPSVILFGSVNPDYIIPDQSNVIAISKHRSRDYVCKSPYCWSSVIGQEGIECIELDGRKQMQIQPMQGKDECAEVDSSEIPPCVKFTTEQVIDAINKITNANHS